MKTSRLIYVTIPIFLLISCSNPSDRDVSTEGNSNTEVYNDHDTIPDYEEVINRRKNDQQSSRITETEYQNNLSKDRTDIYSGIGMNDADISRFEADYKKKLNDMNSSGLGNYTLEDLHSQEDKSMKATLTDAQYKKYTDYKTGRSARDTTR